MGKSRQKAAAGLRVQNPVGYCGEKVRERAGGNCKVLPFGWRNPWYQSRLGDEGLKFFRLEKSRLQGQLLAAIQYIKAALRKLGTGF